MHQEVGRTEYLEPTTVRMRAVGLAVVHTIGWVCAWAMQGEAMNRVRRMELSDAFALETNAALLMLFCALVLPLVGYLALLLNFSKALPLGPPRRSGSVGGIAWFDFCSHPGERFWIRDAEQIARIRNRPMQETPETDCPGPHPLAMLLAGVAAAVGQGLGWLAALVLAPHSADHAVGYAILTAVVYVGVLIGGALVWGLLIRRSGEPLLEGDRLSWKGETLTLGPQARGELRYAPTGAYLAIHGVDRVLHVPGELPLLHELMQRLARSTEDAGQD